MTSISYVGRYLPLLLSLLLVVEATEVSGLPAGSRGMKKLNETDTNVIDKIIYSSTSSLSGNESVCSSAYSCKEACSNDQQIARKLENITGVLAENTVDNFCFCDSRCQQFADCCHDYDDYCSRNESIKYHHVHLSTHRVFYSAELHPEEDGIPYTVEAETFECIKIEQYPSSAFWAKTLCPSEWTNDYVRDLCVNPIMDDMLTQLPVIDSDKTVYRNAFCAECNLVWEYKFMLLDSVCAFAIPSHIINNNHLFSAFLSHNCVTYIRSGLSEPPRACLRTVNTCPKSFYHTETITQIDRACDQPVQFPVLVFSNYKEPVMYKNADCALCNGAAPPKYRCFTEVPVQSAESIAESFSRPGVIEHNDIYGKLFMDREAGADATENLHHVITNYNSDMTRTVVLEEDDKYIVPIVHECPYGAVFDPLSGHCRQIHCEAGYVLRGNECVLSFDTTVIVNHMSDLASEAMGGKNGTPMAHRFKLIITVNVSTDSIPALEFIWNNTVLRRFVQFLNVSGLDVLEHFENSTWAFVPAYPRYLNNTQVDASFNASGDGQVFITVTYTPHFQTEDWHGTKEVIIEFCANVEAENSVVVAADYEVYVDDEEIDTGDLDLKVVVDTVTRHSQKLYNVIDECETDVFAFYSSSEIIFANGSDPSCPNIWITYESRWYGCDHTIYFGYDPDGGPEQVFYVFVCSDVYALPPDCPRIMYNASEYVILPNGTVVVDNGFTYESDEYELNDGYLVVCSNFSTQINEIYVFFFGFTSAQIYMLYVVGIFSDICLLLTIITYLIFRDLRTLPGLNLLGLMVANMCCNCSLLAGGTAEIGSDSCVAGAILIHYFTMANLCWMTCIAFDAYLTFGGSRRRIFSRFQATCPRKKRYLMYSAFAWGVPGFIVSLGILFNFCECGPFPMWYGRYLSCLINDPQGFLYLFTIPASVFLLCNYVLFILAIRGIKSAKIKSSKYNSANAQRDIFVYIKLLSTTGFGWVVGYIAAISEVTFLWSCFLILVSLQGVFIFLAFFCSQRVLALYAALVQGRRNERLTRGSSTTTIDNHRASTNSSLKRSPSISQEIDSASSGGDKIGIDAAKVLERVPTSERISECSDDGIEFMEDKSSTESNEECSVAQSMCAALSDSEEVGVGIGDNQAYQEEFEEIFL